MLCPEGAPFQNETLPKEEENLCCQKNKKVPIEGTASLEIHSYKSPKSWKKSITNFFRNQLRSTKSNDGDRPSDSKENFEEKEISPEQKWQSLGKMFKRQSFGEHWPKPSNHQGESSTQNKRHAVRKVISSYFGKPQKYNTSDPNEE
ncbi:uncharacterized protein LOC112053489 [Bicyclus anynana]|uniref:Uncharacterized protein LOC112053489 n=1 Tax=Bicyclus anynana TaxID=110368 RepID=A0A6J1NP69_BICAN|nr:uncharacterized protein LOC112053489 [Bicyclus anynana]